MCWFHFINTRENGNLELATEDKKNRRADPPFVENQISILSKRNIHITNTEPLCNKEAKRISHAFAFKARHRRVTIKIQINIHRESNILLLRICIIYLIDISQVSWISPTIHNLWKVRTPETINQFTSKSILPGNHRFFSLKQLTLPHLCVVCLKIKTQDTFFDSITNTEPWTRAAAAATIRDQILLDDAAEVYSKTGSDWAGLRQRLVFA